MNFLDNNVISKYIHWFLRIVMAGIFFYHGYPKLGTSVANLGIIGYLVGPFEVLGGLFILIGPFTEQLLTRIGGIMIAIIMIGAIYMHIFKWNDTFFDVEYQILLLAISLVFTFKGDEI